MKVGSIYSKKDSPLHVMFDDNGNVIDVFDQISIDRVVFIGVAISIIIGIMMTPLFVWILGKL